MTEPAKKTERALDARARWTFGALAIGSFSLTALLTAVPLYVGLQQRFDAVVKLGLVQTLALALLALAIVSGTRLTLGRYVGERRKGGSSASSATIAVRLWALCFALLAGATLLFAAVEKMTPSPAAPIGQAARPRPMEIELQGPGVGSGLKIKVNR